MNLEQHTNSEAHDTAPWVFSLETRIDPRSVSDKDILNCVVYRNVSSVLTKQLFEVQKLLRDSLQGGLSVQLYDVTLEHFDLEGRFDRAVCRLTLFNRGPSRFLLETHFLLEGALVTVARQEGILHFEELN
jgi:hypothetical protein